MAGIATTAIDLDAAYKNTRFVLANVRGKNRYYLTAKFDITQRVEEQALGTRLVDSVCKLFFASQDPERLQTAKGIFTCLTQIAPSVDIEWRIKQVMPSLESARLKESPKDIPKPPTQEEKGDGVSAPTASTKKDKPKDPELDGKLSTPRTGSVSVEDRDLRLAETGVQKHPLPAVPKPRVFEGSGCSLRVTKEAGKGEKFLNVLRKNGLHDQLSFKIETDSNGDTDIHFLHHEKELCSLTSKHPDLIEFFYSGGAYRVFGTTYRNQWFYDKSPGKKKPLIENLIAEADHRFRGTCPPPVKCTITPASLKSDEALFRDTFGQGFKGLCVGEYHSQQNSKKFIIDNLKTLKSMGVKTLFMEFLIYDTMQVVLDEYCKKPPGAPMPVILETFLADLDEGHRTKPPYNYTNLVRAAHDAGFRIVGLDTTLSDAAGYDFYKGAHGPDRIKAFNHVAERIIRHECGHDGYIALMGGAHGDVNSGDDKSSWHPIPGVATRLRCPFFVIEDSKDRTSKVETYVRDICRSRRFIHVYMKRPTGAPAESAEHKKP